MHGSSLFLPHRGSRHRPRAARAAPQPRQQQRAREGEQKTPPVPAAAAAAAAPRPRRVCAETRAGRGARATRKEAIGAYGSEAAPPPPPPPFRTVAAKTAPAEPPPRGWPPRRRASVGERCIVMGAPSRCAALRYHGLTLRHRPVGRRRTRCWRRREHGAVHGRAGRAARHLRSATEGCGRRRCRGLPGL